MAASRSISSVVLSRYAGALVDLAEQEKSVDKVQADLDTLVEMVAKSADLAMMISSPLISKSKQQAVMSDIADKAKFNLLTRNFLCVLAQNRRLNILVDIIGAVQKMIAARNGQEAVFVKTAVALTEAQKKDLKAKISSSLGHDVSLEVQVDPSILGGMIVTIGSKMIDDSVRRKLERLNAALTKRANTNTIETLKEVV